MSYHSLEDRIVKNTFKLEATDCICPPAIINCICEHHSKLKIITKRPLTPDAEEISSNVRSRSAKLRVAEKKKGEQ
jgi:16S rRNA (cytosine1402-N4)-methyltransferase